MVDGNVFVVRIISPFNHKMASPKQVCAILYSAVSMSVPFVTNEWHECLVILLLPYIIVPYPLSWTPRVYNWVVMLIAVTV